MKGFIELVTLDINLILNNTALRVLQNIYSFFV